MKKLLILGALLSQCVVFAQQLPVNCDLAIPGCTLAGFELTGENPAYNITDFGVGTIANPSANPSSGNAGCLLSGETVSTFVTIEIYSSGHLEWSAIGLDTNGAPSEEGCFDWIMWNVTNQPVGNHCAGIFGNTLPPVSCNWNGMCNGNTGMAFPANFPPNAAQSSYEPPLSVLAGQTYILCLSNYSGTTQALDLTFFGTAGVGCGVDAPDQAVCEGNSVQVSISTPGYDAPEFTWLNTDGVSDPNGGTNVTVTPAATTTYDVAIYQAPVGGLQELYDTATFTIVVETPVTATTSITDTVEICPGETADVEGLPAQDVTWQWLLNGAPLPGAVEQTFSASEGGSYTLVAGNSCGTDTSDVFVVNVATLAAGIDSSGPLQFCEGGAVTLEAGPAGAATYEWLLDGQAVTDSVSGTFTASESGVYSVVVSDGCASDTVSATVIVHELPQTPLIVENDGYLGLDPGSVSAMVGYQWFLEGDTIPGATADTIVPAANGAYTVTVTGEDGCSSTSSAFEVDNVGLGETDALSLQIAPNPAKDVFTVSFTPGTLRSLTVLDLNGKAVATKVPEPAGDSLVFDFSAYGSGVYLLRAEGISTTRVERISLTK